MIMRSPPRKLTVQDQKDWKIPACISNWKNAAGYTVPLHMRLQADGRGLKDTTVNERHAVFADALYAAERQARKETETRAKVQASIRLAQAKQKEDELRQMAAAAKAEKVKLMASTLKEREVEQGSLNEPRKRRHSSSSSSSDSAGDRPRKRTHEEMAREEARRERDAIRAQRRREIVREDRMQRAGFKKSKNERDADRDISEKIALG